jgi:hypothetical protein
MARTTPVLFVSSTQEDLAPYRSAAKDAAIRVGFHPAMMEYFVAAGQNPPYQACMERVADCDVLVVIVAHRYGWIPSDQPGQEGKSITRLECEHANRLQKEVLAFVVDEKHSWPQELRESFRMSMAIEAGNYTHDLAEEVNLNVTRLRDFKTWLNGLGVRAVFTSPEGFRADLEAAL